MNRIPTVALSTIGLLMLAESALADVSPRAEMGASSGIIALNSLPNPPTTLATANVVDVRGKTVGAVHKVVMDAQGIPAP